MRLPPHRSSIFWWLLYCSRPYRCAGQYKPAIIEDQPYNDQYMSRRSKIEEAPVPTRPRARSRKPLKKLDVVAAGRRTVDDSTAGVSAPPVQPIGFQRAEPYFTTLRSRRWQIALVCFG